jgi:hypothetical protein
MQGKLIWFNPDKRHGFILTEEGERLRVEESGFEPGHLLGDRMAGTPLTFERENDCAVRVSVVSYSEPRRARLRHR